MARASDKVEKGAAPSPPSVSIDGSRIRSIREGKRLTQLYVASVVGVTTDTISRWENNRYPSIKRDNAEKLAGALEVELSEILRQDEGVPVAEATPPALLRRPVFCIFLGFLSVAVIFLAVYLLFIRVPAAPTAIRWVPRFAAPGQIIPVQIKVTRRKGDTAGFILKERLPAGFRMVASIPRTSVPDVSGSSIKWLVPGGSASVVISYTMQVPAAPPLPKEASLNGEIVVRAGGAARTEPVAGNGAIRIGPYHWADSNGDGRIDDDEIMPAYYVCEAMTGMGLDWATIEAIWSGKGYSWDDRTGFVVKK